MRRDDSGVAGFFEDLPVLIFVLAGVASIVFSGVFGAEQLEAQRLQDELDIVARSVVENAVARLQGTSVSHVSAPTLDALLRVDLAGLAANLSKGYSCYLCFVRVHPGCEWLSGSGGDLDSRPVAAGFAARQMNYVEGSGAVGILEVRALVWRS